MTTTIPVFSKYFTLTPIKYQNHSSGESGCSGSATSSSSSPCSGISSTTSSMLPKGTLSVTKSLGWSHSHLHQHLHHPHLLPHLTLLLLSALPSLHEGRLKYLHHICPSGHRIRLLRTMVDRWFRRRQRVGDVRSECKCKSRRSNLFLFLLFPLLYHNSDFVLHKYIQVL